MWKLCQFLLRRQSKCLLWEMRTKMQNVWYLSLSLPPSHLSGDIVCDPSYRYHFSCKLLHILLHSCGGHGTSSVPVLLAAWLWVLAKYKRKGLGVWKTLLSFMWKPFSTVGEGGLEGGISTMYLALEPWHVLKNGRPVCKWELGA